VVLAMESGRHSGPVGFGRNFQVVMLLERRPADPPPPPLGEMKQELEFRLKQQQRRRLANEYLNRLRDRLEFDDRGLDVLCKPVDSITDAEKEVPVAVKDKSKYVKVGRMLTVARRFPAGIDTAMRKYAIRRAIEEDLIYEDGLERNLDKLPGVREQVEEKRRNLLYEALFKKEILDKVAVGDDEVRAYFEQNRGNYPGGDLGSVASLIRNRLFEARRDSLFPLYRAGLRAGARIRVDEAVLRSIKVAQEKKAED